MQRHAKSVGFHACSCFEFCGTDAKQVDALSELFVAWDDAVTSAEDALLQFEREKRERERLGLA